MRAINNDDGAVGENSDSEHKDSREIAGERATTKRNSCFRKINYIIPIEKTYIVYLLRYKSTLLY